MSGELKPCPFCGGEASLTIPSEHVQADCADIYISCDECEAEGQRFVVEMQDRTPDLWPYEQRDAIAAWNQRPAPDKLDAATIERLLDPWRRVWMVAFEPFDNGPGEGVGRHAEDAGVADLLPKAWPTIADLRNLATDPHQHGEKGA